MNKPKNADRDFGSTDCSSSSPLEVLIDTGGDDVHHPYTAFNQGFAAFNQGYPDEANPYTKNSENQRFSEAMWWSLGWVEAMEQEDKDFGSDSASVSDPFYHTDFTTAPHPVFNVEAFLKRATATVEECAYLLCWARLCKVVDAAGGSAAAGPLSLLSGKSDHC